MTTKYFIFHHENNCDKKFMYWTYKLYIKSFQIMLEKNENNFTPHLLQKCSEHFRKSFQELLSYKVYIKRNARIICIFPLGTINLGFFVLRIIYELFHKNIYLFIIYIQKRTMLYNVENSIIQSIKLFFSQSKV